MAAVVVEAERRVEKGEEEMGMDLQGRRRARRKNTATSTACAVSRSVNGGRSPAEGGGEGEGILDTNVQSPAEGGGEGVLDANVHLYNHLGNGSTNGYSGIKFTSIEHSISVTNSLDGELDSTLKDGDIQNSLSGEISHQDEEIVMENKLPGFNVLPSEKICEEQTAHLRPLNNEAMSQHEVIELDLGRLLEDPEGYEFSCPNCKACIKRVIVRKREPASQVPQRHEPDDVFRCMECFSFLILAGNRFISLFVPDKKDVKINPANATLGDENGVPAIYRGYVKEIEEKPIAEAQLTRGLAEPVISDDGQVITIPEPVIQEPKHLRGMEILKSIVYGGLVESITSIGVVVSSSGADAATVNILALGLANLISGLFIIVHNLKELKKDHPQGASTQTNVVDRYQEHLGRSENFLLHATVAIISFLIFGLVPLVTYAFAFRESDDRDYKLAAAVAASIICIIILAIGKAHTQKPHKYSTYIKTVLYYVCSGVIVSIVSYAVGNLVMKLMDKLGWFKPSAAPSLSLPQTGSFKPAWSSY